MTKIHLIDFLNNIHSSLDEIDSSKQKASKLKKLLQEEYQKNQLLT
ncbi:MAG: hypothetical protein KAT68_19655 [Bacteroidales bacterium]|nr:hypothetical protein [Bacteroidales bacterium]